MAFRTEAERTIALTRVALAVTSLVAIYLDPAQPARYARLTYLLLSSYVAYSLVILPLSLSRRGWRLPLAVHLTDIALFSVLQFLTLGPSSPFFVYFIFSLFCAAIRWGWQATLWTAGIVVGAYLGMTLWTMDQIEPQRFEFNRVIIRTIYLLVSALLLVYLGRHEERLRAEIERLARWPVATGPDPERVVNRVLRHAVEIMEAQRALVMWEAGDGPVLNVATWPANDRLLACRSPEEKQPLPSLLERSTFTRELQVQGPAMAVTIADGSEHTIVLSPLLAPLEGAAGLTSAPFRTERVTGRAYFAGFREPRSEVVALTDIVAREIGNSLEQLQVTLQLRDIAASEERIRVSRDLHDGVLQSLTGIRLEIRSLASSIASAPEPGRERLIELERALAIEQRELRLFIESLGPSGARRLPSDGDGAAVLAALEALKERMALEWKTPVTLRVTADVSGLQTPVAEAIPLMVHEAVVNALKHAEPSRIAVTIDRNDHHLRIVVADDGQGFPFRGRYDHAALEDLPSGPKSLLDRVGALGGEVAVESSASGSRVEMTLKV